VSLYELAKQVKPDQLKDHESKVIWKGSDGSFAYLIRIMDDEICLRLSGSQFQLLFYHWSGMYKEWVITSENEYKEMAQLWQDERMDRI
jgi:hypothetical protein